MMKNLLFLLCILLITLSCQTEKSKQQTDVSLAKLVSYMEGSFSSEEQSKEDTTFLNITLDTKQIWKDNKDGAWLYVEQTAAWTPGKPYRQRIYHLEQNSDSTFTSATYKMFNPKDFIGGYSNPEMFDILTIDSLEVLKGCTLLLTYGDGMFTGKTEEGACLNSWGDAAYATSEVKLFPDYMYTWDRGWNDKKEQVWGADKGGYRFVKNTTQE